MNELRKYQNFVGGLIEDNPLTAGATAVNSAGLAAISGGVGSTEHMAITIDPDGLGGAPEVAWITALTAATGTATIARGKEGTTAREHARDTPWVHGLVTSDLQVELGFKSYTPGADGVIGVTSSATGVDVDATNLVVTFTAPWSGRVAVELEGLYNPSNTGTATGSWMLRDGSGDVADTERYMSNVDQARHHAARIEKGGLTPGTSYTWKWGHRRVGSGDSTVYGGPTYGPATMRVVAVNRA